MQAKCVPSVSCVHVAVENRRPVNTAALAWPLCDLNRVPSHVRSSYQPGSQIPCFDVHVQKR